MTQEDKELLLKDLCARLSYGVKISCGQYDKNPRNVNSISIVDIGTFLNGYFNKGIRLNFNGNKELWPKSYLRPMSSMTEEEKKYIEDKCAFTTMGPIGGVFGLVMPVIAAEWLIDFYNSHHLDWRDLIPKNLALEAPEGMYNLEKE